MTFNFIEPLEPNASVFTTRRDIAEVFILDKSKTQTRRRIRHSSLQKSGYIARFF